MRLVHEQPVNAEFLERHRVVFLVRGRERFEFSFETFLGFFNFLHDAPIVRVGVFPFDLFQFLQLLLKETLLGFARKWDALETGVRDNDGIPIAGGDAAAKFPPVLRLEILFARDQDVRARIQHEQFAGELAEHVVGHGEHGLARQSQPFQFHRGSDLSVTSRSRLDGEILNHCSAS